MTELEPLPPDLRDLFASERDVSPAERVAIRHKLEASISATPAATSVLAGKTLWLVLGAIATATAIWWLATRDRAPTSTAPQAPQLSETAEPVLAESVLANEPAPPEAAPAPASQPRTTAASQADLLARAWQALAKHDTATTLQLLADDRRLHPDGALNEEREAMQVRALAAAGRTQEARGQAQRFFERWPTSVHRHAIEQLVGRAP